MIYSTTATFCRSDRTKKVTSTSSASTNDRSVEHNNFWTSSNRVAYSELHRKTTPTLSRLGRMLFFRSSSGKRRPFSLRFLLSIWLEIKEELTIWIRTNRPKLMGLRSTNPYSLSKSASELLTRAKAIHLLEAAN